MRGVPIRPGRDGDGLSSLTPLVQLCGHAWTVALYEMFNLTLPTYYSAQADARELSDRLGTVAVEFSSEDTSGATGYQLFECGDLVEFAEWGCEVERFASKKRRPPWQYCPNDYPDELFRDLGLYLPACYGRNDPDGPCLAVDGLSAGDVERADLLALSFSGEEPAAVGRQRAEFPDVHVLSVGGAPPDFEPPADEPPGDEDIPF